MVGLEGISQAERSSTGLGILPNASLPSHHKRALADRFADAPPPACKGLPCSNLNVDGATNPLMLLAVQC